MRVPKVVLIDWLDSAGVTPTWEHIDDIKPLPPIRCTSVGFLLEDQKDYKTIVASIGSGDDHGAQDQVLGRMTITSSSIVRMLVLKDGIDES